MAISRSEMLKTLPARGFARGNRFVCLAVWRAHDSSPKNASGNFKGVFHLCVRPGRGKKRTNYYGRRAASNEYGGGVVVGQRALPTNESTMCTAQRPTLSQKQRATAPIETQMARMILVMRISCD